MRYHKHVLVRRQNVENHQCAKGKRIISILAREDNLKSLEQICALVAPSAISALSSTIVVLAASSYVLPCGTESAPGACKQTLLLVLFKVCVHLLLIQLGDPEKCGKEHDDVDAEEGELRPEQDHAKEREVDGHAVDEGAENRGRADVVSHRVGRKLRAGLDGFLVFRAIWLVASMVDGQVAVRLRAKGRVLRGDDHSDSVVDGQSDESEKDGGHKQRLRGSVALANLEDGEPKEADAGCGNAYDRGGEEEECE